MPPALLLALTLVVSLVLLILIVDVIYTRLLRPSSAPPTALVLPVVGGMLSFLGGPLALISKFHASCGECFTLPVLHKRITFLIGPHASPFFFKAPDTALSQKEVYEFNVPTFGKGVVFDVDHVTRAEQFRFFAEALKGNRMRSYVQMMVKEAEEFFGAWGDEGVVDLRDELSRLVVLTASRCLLGKEVRETFQDEVAHLVHELDMGMVPLSVFFPYFPIEPHRRRDAARKELAKIFDGIVEKRRQENREEEDVLNTFVHAKYRDGSQLTNDQVLGMLIAVLFAGQHTSSITSTWTGLLLLESHQKQKKGILEGSGKSATFLEKVLDEQRKVIAEHGDELTFDILQSMDSLHFSIKEALRMHPPLIMLLRYAHAPFDVTTSDGKTYTVPKGDIIATSPAYSHRLDHVFDKADEYKPSRLEPGAAEDAKVPFSFIGFGGGRHGCMGEAFAYLQIKAIWSIALRNFEFELIGDNAPEADLTGMVVGPYASQVRFKRRKLK